MQSYIITLLYQILIVKPDQADTYKCFATNEYGNAVCTAILNVIPGIIINIIILQYVCGKYKILQP